MARARRLFTTVNRYAKKTSPVIDIVMDEDDGLAIITRRLIRENEFFSSRIKVLAKQGKGVQKLATGEAMLPADKRYLMAIGTLYKCNRNLLPADLEQFFRSNNSYRNTKSLRRGLQQLPDDGMT
jgi:DNA sulfur modification protein DndB